jgi:hypothetical protein
VLVLLAPVSAWVTASPRLSISWLQSANAGPASTSNVVVAISKRTDILPSRAGPPAGGDFARLHRGRIAAVRQAQAAETGRQEGRAPVLAPPSLAPALLRQQQWSVAAVPPGAQNSPSDAPAPGFSEVLLSDWRGCEDRGRLAGPPPAHTWGFPPMGPHRRGQPNARRVQARIGLPKGASVGQDGGGRVAKLVEIG